MSMLKCPLCKRPYLTAEGIVEHLVNDHTPAVVAEELVNRYVAGANRCGKKCFPNQAGAERVLILNTISTSPRRREIRSYKCNQCAGSWHLTSHEPWTAESA
jgi:hypothetical protein